MDFSELSKNLDNLPLHLKLSLLSLVNQEQVDNNKKSTSVTDPSKLLPSVHFFKNEKGEAILRSEKLNFFTEPILLQLEDPGFYIFDGFLGKEQAAKCHEDAQKLYENNILRPSSMSKGEEKWHDKNVRGDFILWVSDLSQYKESHPDLFLLLSRLQSLQTELNQACNFDSTKIQVQVTCYPGEGSRYVRHLDAFSGGSNRRLTCLYYMNPNWESSCGGHLRIYKENGGALDVEPLQDRLLIFQSRRLEHEVMPTFKHRFAITMWFY